MAKGYSFVDLPKPANCSASIVTGGTLVENTTYYYRIIGVVSTGTTGLLWYGKSQASEEFSATTDPTKKSVSISFESELGKCGAYRIFRSTSPNGMLTTNTSTAVLGYITFYPKDSDYNVNGTVTFVDTGYGVSREDHIELVNNPHGVLTLSGSTSSDMFSIEDLYQADLANGWGVISRIGYSTYKVNCYLVGHVGMY